MTGFVKCKLTRLFREAQVIQITGTLSDRQVTGIVYDSRETQPGNVFVALRGGSTDGHLYIDNAVEQGAIAVVGMEAAPEGFPVPYIQVPDTRAALAEVSAAFFDFPAREMTVIGVTGTDGKTTTASLIYQILMTAGIRAGMVSTVSARVGGEELDTGFHVTTPEAPDVQRYLARMRNAGLTHVILESTSHGLAQHRVGCCEFDIGVVTNITHEHLDYHGSYDAYREAKARLFLFLSETHKKKHGNPRLAVLNKDDRSYEYLKAVTKVRQVAYSLKKDADLWAEDVVYNHIGLHFTAVGRKIHQPVQSNLVGAFNVSNCLAAFSTVVFGLGIDPVTAAKGIAALSAVPGRMERIDLGQNFITMVDFAHTPNALEMALNTARQMTDGKVIAVFGSAGLRDRAKRRMMAEVSTRLADITVLTAEDPRTESLDDILEEMASAALTQGGIEEKTFWRIPDRGNAIRFALTKATAGDVVISCGKGHEQSMCFGTEEYPWDDRQALQAALADYLSIEGPEMPYLPTQDL